MRNNFPKYGNLIIFVVELYFFINCLPTMAILGLFVGENGFCGPVMYEKRYYNKDNKQKLTIWEISASSAAILDAILDLGKCPMMPCWHYADPDSTSLPPSESTIYSLWGIFARSPLKCPFGWRHICIQTGTWEWFSKRLWIDVHVSCIYILLSLKLQELVK